MSNFNITTYQQAKYDFYFTFNLIRTIFQEKIYKAEHETTLF